MEKNKNKQKRIAFFELYRRWKSFTVWKKTVRAFKFTQASSALKTGLFAFVPPLRLAIAEIRTECVDVEKRRLFAVGQGETITLEAFLERQRTTQQEVAQVCFLIGMSILSQRYSYVSGVFLLAQLLPS